LIYSGNKHIKIKKDIDSFLASEKWYRDRGITYKRCYFLYGPPGTGKTSLVLSIARELRRDVYLLDLQAMTNEEQLVSTIAAIGDRSIVVVEDADKTLNKTDLKLSLSSLLNVLDGPFTKKGLLLFMTTNHEDRIDPAILRDGRFDVKEEIGLASNSEIEVYLKLFYGLDSALPLEVQLPMAAVQEICIRNKKDARKATAEICSKAHLTATQKN
jgi:chaperone BCS1